MDITIEEYARRFKMSKEMVASKIRQKKLNFTIQNGITMINIPDEVIKAPVIEPKQELQIQKSVMQKATVATVLGLYKRENTYLKQKIEQLEAKIDKLIDDKEQMLRDERDKIESIYTNKDEQLKSVLELINTKMNHDAQQNQTVYEIEHSENTAAQIIELKEYLKTLELKSSQRKKIKRRFEEALHEDIRLIEQNGKIFLDFSRYDYSDLLAL
jgi:ATP-dependent Lon protease